MLKSEKSCADLLSKHILANTNDIHKVKDIASRMLERSLEQKISIGVIGEPKSGKTSLIQPEFKIIFICRIF